MATPTKDTEHFDDLLTCTICLETFKVPKYLPCLHTFCESCINTYIVSSVEKGKITEGFTCPVCRKIVSGGDKLEKPELWAPSLPTNHFVTSMLDKRAIKKAEKMCDSCLLNKEKTKAKSWCTICEEAFCKECEKCHKNFKMSARHKLLNLQEMESGRTPFEVCEVQSCDEHPGKIIEFYCLDHSQPCCTSCATLSHRKCENVTSIQKAASGIKQSTKASGLSQKLREHVIQLGEIIDDRNKNLADVANSTGEIKTRVADIKTEILKHLDRIEETLLTELTSTKKQVGIELKDEVGMISSYSSAVKKWKTVIDSVLEHGSEQQCLMEINKIEPKISELEQEIEDLVKNIKSVKVVFSPSSPITDFIRNTKSFGNIKIDKSSVSSLSCNLEIDKVDFRTGSINILQVIDVCNGAGSTSGIFVQNLLLFTVCEKNKVVKYNNDGQSLLSELALSGAPADIAVVTQFKVAVSSRGQGVCVVDSDKMTLLQTLNLPGIPVYGISFVNEELFITCDSYTLTWINLSSGKTINQKRAGNNSYFVLSLSQTDYMYADSLTSVDYVVGNTKKFTYTNSDLSYPRGIGIDCMGNLYIAANGSRNIHQITNGGELIRKIPASTVGIKKPWTIRFAPRSNKFIVTCNSSGKAALCEIVSK
ncbi:tripartite motif-containing protein 2/3 [Mytilus galloprovincialis]|uniref:Tripartite motif-containing protein 2/3 n=1 Tax=Mytilus galloprovincialis TaxID=29158 RepID=A0A8B6C9V8_MYTGA|nr:tripartite motif-containing protein 2/3 [Mytilus galloprovincialis]